MPEKQDRCGSATSHGRTEDSGLSCWSDGLCHLFLIASYTLVCLLHTSCACHDKPWVLHRTLVPTGHLICSVASPWGQPSLWAFNQALIIEARQPLSNRVGLITACCTESGLITPPHPCSGLLEDLVSTCSLRFWRAAHLYCFSHWTSYLCSARWCLFS